MTLIKLKDEYEVMTVPIPINFRNTEIGAVLVNHLEIKFGTRTVPVSGLN